MQMFVAIVGFFAIPVGLAGAIAPDSLRKLLASGNTTLGFYFGVVKRLVLGVLFIIAAPECRIPEVIVFFGIFILAGAGLLFYLREEGKGAFGDWWTNLHPRTIRIWSLASAAAGVLIVNASG